MLALDLQRLTHRLLATVDEACLVLAAAGQQHGVQVLQVAGRGHRDKMISAEGPDFTFHATLFMALTRRTEARYKIPMRSEGHEARRLLATETAQDLLHRRAKVVVAQSAERPAQVLKPQFVSFKESLLRRTQVGPMKCRSAGHAAHRKHLYRDPLAVQGYVRLVPIHLCLVAPGVLLWHEGLGYDAQPQGSLALPHVLTHRRLGDLIARPLTGNPHPDAMRRVALLPRRLPICFQNLVDEPGHRADRRPRPLFNWQPHRDRTLDGLAHHPSVHAELACHPRNAG